MNSAIDVVDDPRNANISKRIAEKIRDAILVEDWDKFRRNYCIYSSDALDYIDSAPLHFNTKLTTMDISTANPQALSRNINNIVEALAGEFVTADLRNSWTWDHKNRRPTGSPTHITVYRLKIYFGAKKPFVPANATHIASSMNYVCLVDHPIVGLCLFDYQREHNIQCFGSYQWNPDGFFVWCETKEDVERLRTLFPTFTITVAPKKTDGFWHVNVKIT